MPYSALPGTGSSPRGSRSMRAALIGSVRSWGRAAAIRFPSTALFRSVRRPHGGVGATGVEPPGLLVGERGGLLDPDDRVDGGGGGEEVGDGEVLAGPLGLNAVQRDPLG